MRRFLLPAISMLCAVAGCGRSLPLPPDAEDFDVRERSDSGVGPDGGDDRDSGPPPPGARCGNGVREARESCDGADLDGSSCRSLGFESGALACDAACELDSSGCRGMVPDACRSLPPSALSEDCMARLCECDPDAFAACDDTCFDLLACVGRRCMGQTQDLDCIINNCGELLVGAPAVIALRPCIDDSRDVCVPDQPSSCGNGRLEDFERCDGRLLGGESCRSLGLGSGTLRCNAVCGYDLRGCNDDARCGDGELDPGEACDGSAFGDVSSCRALGLRGELACRDDCSLDRSGCHACGDGVIQAGERCDGDNLGGLSCQRLGFTGGALACDASCAFDTGGCAVCGNGVIETGENCDGAALGGASCTSLGLGSGALSCHPSACLLDISGCDSASPLACGNGVAEVGEQCDGEDLTSVGCVDLGFDEGELGCNRATCRFDSSDCSFAGEPEPGEGCRECSQRACAEISAACEADATCTAGLECLAERCGATGDVSCALGCFQGSLPSAITAVSMFGCVASSCGETCIGL